MIENVGILFKNGLTKVALGQSVGLPSRLYPITDKINVQGY